MQAPISGQSLPGVEAHGLQSALLKEHRHEVGAGMRPASPLPQACAGQDKPQSIGITPRVDEGWLVGSPLTMSLQAAAPGTMRAM